MDLSNDFSSVCRPHTAGGHSHKAPAISEVMHLPEATGEANSFATTVTLYLGKKVVIYKRINTYVITRGVGGQVQYWYPVQTGSKKCEREQNVNSRGTFEFALARPIETRTRAHADVQVFLIALRQSRVKPIKPDSMRCYFGFCFF